MKEPSPSVWDNQDGSFKTFKGTKDIKNPFEMAEIW